jgi:peptide deformylase
METGFVRLAEIMAILPILTAPDKRLKQKAKPVTQVDSRIHQLMDDMLETMYDAPGIGLAATQVGEPVRVIVLDIGKGEDRTQRDPQCLVNPEIVANAGERIWEEGCLSVPEYTADVTRAERVTVRALDRTGQEITLEADGLLAICLQHEIDHLNGVLFIDRLSRLKRDIILKKLKKQKNGD